ncbi:MAG TPA: hypothetical protein PLI77_10180 [Bacteroidales bacterium]|nr:hypothetical protein [Bacteroidales bacterium]
MKKLIIVLMIVITLLPVVIGCGGSSGYGELEEAYVVLSVLTYTADKEFQIKNESYIPDIVMTVMDEYTMNKGNSVLESAYLDILSAMSDSKSTYKSVANSVEEKFYFVKSQLNELPPYEYCHDKAFEVADTFLSNLDASGKGNDAALCVSSGFMVLYHPETPQSLRDQVVEGLFDPAVYVGKGSAKKMQEFLENIRKN